MLGVVLCVQVEHVNRHLEESERGLQERIFKLENQRIHLEEVDTHAHTHAHTEAHAHTHTEAHTHAHTQVHTYIYTQTRADTRTHSRTHTIRLNGVLPDALHNDCLDCVCACACARVRVCVCACPSC